MTDQPEALRLAEVLPQFGGATCYQAAAELRRLHARAEFAEQQMVELAEERDHYRRLLEKAQQAEPVRPVASECATFAGLPMTDGDKRLAAMLTQAFGTDHPAIHDLVALLFAARGKQQAEPVHADDAMAIEFCEAMREKLAKQRAKGYGGWEACNPNFLRDQLAKHVGKGDPVDVANFCAMLWSRGESTAQQAEPVPCSHCASPLFAALECRVCGRKAEPT